MLLRYFIHLFIYCFINWLLCRLLHSFIHWFINSLPRNFIHSFIYCFINSLLRNFINLSVYCFINSLIRFVYKLAQQPNSYFAFFREMHWRYFRIFFQTTSQNTKNASQTVKKFSPAALLFYLASLGRIAKLLKFIIRTLMGELRQICTVSRPSHKWTLNSSRRRGLNF